MTFKRYIEDTGLKKSVENICAHYTAESWDSVKVAAACHLYTASEIRATSRPSRVTKSRVEVQNLKDTLLRGGNCVDKSVFLGSLLTHVSGVEPRTVQLFRRPVGHVLVEARFPRHSDQEVKRSLTDFYLDNTRIRSFSMIREIESGKSWFVADPGMSRYIGDPKHLDREGYINLYEDGWSWKVATRTEYF